jgi:ACS family tartrate transporter-like MFS transporter
MAMLPYAAATAGTVLWSRSSDRRAERKLHCALPLLLAGACLLAAAASHQAVLAMGR